MIQALVASELKQRIRGKKWWILLVLWSAFLALVVAVIRASAVREVAFNAQFEGVPNVQVGPTMFGSLALFVLGLSCLIVPSLAAGTINGERDRGTLAVLQATLYTNRHIALAKFLSAFITASGFIAASLPLALWSAAEGGVSLLEVVIVYLVLLMSCVLLIAIAMAASALISRPQMSSLAAYIAVFALTGGLPILFGLSMLSADGDIGNRWLLLAPDPFVVLADAAPVQGGYLNSDPLAAIRGAVRDLRDPYRYERYSNPNFLERKPVPREPPPVWPVGLLIQAGIVGFASYEVLRKLRVPARRLSVGERVA